MGYEVKAQYAAIPSGADLPSIFGGCYTIVSFTQGGLAWYGLEAQPAFTQAQRDALDAANALIFNNADAFLQWRDNS